MLRHISQRPYYLLALSTTFPHPITALAQNNDTNTTNSLLSYARRERATRVLTIANTIEPEQTATALRLARNSIRANPLPSAPCQDRTFLNHSIKEAVARGIACAAGGAAASYAIIKIVLLIIPLVPSPLVTKVAISAVSFGSAVVELAAFPDITTVELLMMKDSDLGKNARRSMERYNPNLLLLNSVDRHLREDEEGQNVYQQRKKYRHSNQIDDLLVDNTYPQEAEFVGSEFHFR